MVRTRSEGDFMYPKGMNGRKKIKDIFIDKKVPRDMRDKIPVIALGSEILWIIGIRDTKIIRWMKIHHVFLKLK